jgi:hypothetical protein
VFTLIITIVYVRLFSGFGKVGISECSSAGFLLMIQNAKDANLPSKRDE